MPEFEPEFTGTPEELRFRNVFRARQWDGRIATEEQIDALWAAYLRHQANVHAELKRQGIVTRDGRVLDRRKRQAVIDAQQETWRRTAREVLGHAN